MTARKLGLKVGDVVTVTCNPTIEFTQYVKYKPFASVQRTIESLDEELDDLGKTVRTLCLQNLQRELKLAVKYEGKSAEDLLSELEQRFTKEVESSVVETKKDKRSK